jgi:hypothetical protein
MAMQRVVQFLRQCGERGAIDDEIAEATQLDKNTCASARLEMYRTGFILNSGRTRPTRLGVAATVWKVASCAPVGAGLTVIRHQAGSVVLTRGGGLLQACTSCGQSLCGPCAFEVGPVFEINGTLSSEHLPGAREIACTARRRRAGGGSPARPASGARP